MIGLPRKEVKVPKKPNPTEIVQVMKSSPGMGRTGTMKTSNYRNLGDTE